MEITKELIASKKVENPVLKSLDVLKELFS